MGVREMQGDKGGNNINRHDVYDGGSSHDKPRVILHGGSLSPITTSPSITRMGHLLAHYERGNRS